MGIMDFFGKRSAVRTVFGSTGTPTEKTQHHLSTSLKKYLETDPVLTSNTRQIVMAIHERPIMPKAKSGKPSQKKKIDNLKRDIDKTEFYTKLQDATPALFWNGNAFLEVVVANGRLNEVYVIDPETIKPVEDDYGNVLKWVQNQPEGDVEIPKERIVHIRMPSLKTDTMSESYIKPLSYVLARKEVAENYLAGMIQNMSPMIFLKFSEVLGDHEIDQIKNELRAKKGPIDPFKIVGLKENDVVERVKSGDTEEFASVQDYINSLNDEIIRILHVPPIVAGTVDNSNRSNSEIQERAVFGRTVSFFQNLIVEQLNKRLLMDKLGMEDITFEFPVVDERKKETAIVRAQKLKELGFTNDVIHKYLTEEGLDIANDFVPEPETENVVKDINDMESRRPRDKGGVPQNEQERLNSRANGTEVKTNG
jgi:hypothetical protein